MAESVKLSLLISVILVLSYPEKGNAIGKRSVSSPRFIEILVVADATMSEFYANDDLVSYLLTLMNSVSKMFQHSSVGNSLTIQIVRVMLLDVMFSEEDQNGNCNAEAMLERFCLWQNSVNVGNDSDPEHHDAAVLVTRCKLCTNSSATCSTYGLAELGGICHPLRSCSLARDTGLYTTYTVAHELGHNRNELECLNDESENPYPTDDILPGIKYDADHQCTLFFGAESASCAQTDEELAASCGMLWCRHQGNCVSKGEKAADGTECGKYKWCIQGKCVQVEEPPLPIDGGWGEWSYWSDCSRTCGGGVSYSERFCENPKAEHGGRYCIGERRKYKLCNTESCVNATTSFRGEQCSAFNDVPYENQYYIWTPVYIQGSPCQLHCKPENTSFIVSLASVVVDGTPCRPGKRNVCINGLCKAIGCDWVINSDASEDICGVCSGTGRTCERIQSFEHDGLNCSGSAHPLTSIPRTAKNIRIVHTTSNNEGLIIQGSTYLKLQATLSVGWSGEFNFGENILYYSRDVDTGTVYISGPLETELSLWFICYDQGVSRVDWEYVLPLHNEIEETEEYRWEMGEWSVCSSSCGEGIQIALPVCFRVESQTVVSDVFCSSIPQPQPTRLQRPCLLQNCPPRWWTGAWQPCSQTCGSQSYRRRTILCVVTVENTEVPLEDLNACGDKRPDEEELCDLPDCQYGYRRLFSKPSI